VPDAQAPLKTPITVEELASEELYGVLLKAAGETAALSGEALKRNLRAAEDFYERDLGIRFKDTRVFSGIFERQNAATQAAKLDLPGNYNPDDDLEQPALDYDPQMLRGGEWGPLTLYYRPARTISQVVFCYPGTDPVFKVPLHWIKPNLLHGQFRIVPGPGQAVITARFGSFFLSVAGGGQYLPQSIYVDYAIGFTAAELIARHADLLKGIRLRAIFTIFGIAGNALTGGSTGGGLSLDGLSHSRSFGGEFGPYSGPIKLFKAEEGEIRATWKRNVQGVPMAWV